MKSIISVKGLQKDFGSFRAVDNISFDVLSGQIFAFLGPNGAGKTTTIKMLTTLLNPTSGEIIIDGFNPEQDKHDVRKSFGIVFQDPSLDDELTALENLQFHAALYSVDKKVRYSRIKHLMEMVDLWEKRDDFVKTFSGGMKRRLEMARGLIHHPKILFLDEPTLGLDPQTRKKIWDYILKLNKSEKMTVFFSTHYMPEAELVADQVAIIDHGKIIMKGTVRELIGKTDSNNLEEAFLNLTGRSIRDENSSSIDRMRMARKVWKR